MKAPEVELRPAIDSLPTSAETLDLQVLGSRCNLNPQDCQH